MAILEYNQRAKAQVPYGIPVLAVQGGADAQNWTCCEPHYAQLKAASMRPQEAGTGGELQNTALQNVIVRTHEHFKFGEDRAAHAWQSNEQGHPVRPSLRVEYEYQ